MCIFYKNRQAIVNFRKFEPFSSPGVRQIRTNRALRTHWRLNITVMPITQKILLNRTNSLFFQEDYFMIIKNSLPQGASNNLFKVNYSTNMLCVQYSNYGYEHLFEQYSYTCAIHFYTDTEGKSICTPNHLGL